MNAGEMDWLPIIGYLGIEALIKKAVGHFLAVKSKADDRLPVDALRL